MKSDNLFTGIKQQLRELVESKCLTDAELVQVINAVTELINELSLAFPTKLQRFKMMLGLMRQEDLWQIAYDRKMHQLEMQLRPHQLEIVKKVIVQGVLGES